jgi:hypothetical protein
MRPSCAGIIRLPNSEGAGNAGRSLRPQPCVRNEKAHKHNHHGHTGITRHSPRNGFNSLYRALPGDRAFLPPSPREVASARLDSSVGASGPHDFAVRGKTAPSSEALPASTASRPAFVTIASRPCMGRDGARYTSDLHFGKTEIFFRKGLDKRPNAKSQTAPDGQITCVSKRSPEERSDSRGLRSPAWRCAYAGYSLSRWNGPHRSAL